MSLSSNSLEINGTTKIEMDVGIPAHACIQSLPRDYKNTPPSISATASEIVLRSRCGKIPKMTVMQPSESSEPTCLKVLHGHDRVLDVVVRRRFSRLSTDSKLESILWISELLRLSKASQG